jgi:hypothetical protein
VQVVFHNTNAADEQRRGSHRGDQGTVRRASRGGRGPFIAVFLHSLVRTTLSYVTDEEGRREVNQKQLEMTADGMAHSIVYWVQDLFHAGLITGGRLLCDQRGRPEGRPNLRAG